MVYTVIDALIVTLLLRPLRPYGNQVASEALGKSSKKLHSINFSTIELVGYDIIR